MLLIKILFVPFESIWRRAFGDDGFGLPILKHRIVLHIINVAALFSYMFFVKGFNPYVAVYCALALQICFYTLSFYSGFDMGHSYPPSQKEIDDYGLIGKILDKIFPQDKWYKYQYDFCFMWIRYTYPLLLVVYWFNPLFLLVGLVVASGYALGWHYKPWGLTTEFGEYCMGAALALGLILC